MEFQLPDQFEFKRIGKRFQEILGAG